MARHWLIRRDVLAQARGFTAEYTQALELDLLLRPIEDSVVIENEFNAQVLVEHFEALFDHCQPYSRACDLDCR